ncbi:MAG: bifunctional riboflavin kinase/FAD synthetase [Planctomycetales bacterium]|nr:bifunctional riboflavin kinase/FAD synthetase [Planctomycetales bacterium]NIM09538.1 bifunctional riboflavin kinase/FAD synthetase [Planctomycetales bacterium]NIN07375.1 bifunctional riboflavin kinase/FAD synthetase [Planctomycetales bacterium]NIN76479.1 bifunctional riboflavin kinase/FAD synthetase [Planctomycetales bacterium]NIO35326.1 bifunctional riboflavin kinase/FAD synthetase [Planctomycetales bacterium]
MEIFNNLANLPPAVLGGAVSIGNFDGVHLGHARIIGRLTAWARQIHGAAVVFTFDPHPVRLLRPSEAPPPLTWTDRKAELLGRLGVDAVIAYPTDLALLQLEPAAFFQQIVCQRLAARAVVEGPNFHFGRNRAGTIERLASLAAEAEVQLEVVQPVEVDGQPVSSSRVRQHLAAGDVDRVRALLTQPYRLRGMVTHGAARGAKIGFPTANLEAIDTLLPGDGVYAGVGRAGTCWPAAINVGPNPTFGETARKVEVHLIGCEATLYGQPLELDFLSRIRDIQPFASVEDLQRQLSADVQRVQELVKRLAGSEP